jgi:predicted nucleic-acid-binding Zn-ribbon protein
MSGETDGARPPAPDASAKDLDFLLTGIGIALNCPRCGNATWWAMGRAEAPKTPVLVGIHNLMVYTVVCQKCGLIQQHVGDIVEGKIGTNR